MKNRKQLKQMKTEDRNLLFTYLAKGLNLTQIANLMNFSISTIQKEIKRNKKLVLNTRYRNRCGFKLICDKHNVCGNEKCTHQCKDCRNYKNCNEMCGSFTHEPICHKLKKICNVCNGCSELKDCKLNHWLYDPTEADQRHQKNLSEAHKGLRITNDEIIRLTNFLKPFLGKNLSLETIKNQYPTQVPYSLQSLYNWISQGVLPGIDNLMLPRRVRYARRKPKKIEPINDYAYLSGRLYEDFIAYTTENPLYEVVEMDTVEGFKKNSFILTLLFRRSNFMMAFILRDHSSQSVIEVFDMIKRKLGNEIFKNTFRVILTDRGSEFKKPVELEVDSKTGDVLTHIFYCDSRQSQQKGKIEKNHEELRKIFPKGSIGSDFSNLSQDILNDVLNHINSYPRKLFGYKTPYDIFASYADRKVLEMVNTKKIPFDKLILSKHK